MPRPPRHSASAPLLLTPHARVRAAQAGFSRIKMGPSLDAEWDSAPGRALSVQLPGFDLDGPNTLALRCVLNRYDADAL